MNGPSERSHYAYLTNDVPDFFWTQTVKDPIDGKWEGESQAPGVMMGDIQKLYNASTGAYRKYAVAGGFGREGERGREEVGCRMSPFRNAGARLGPSPSRSPPRGGHRAPNARPGRDARRRISLAVCGVTDPQRAEDHAERGVASERRGPCDS